MILIRLVQGEAGLLKRLEASGHAGAGVKGNDPICAAVSALLSALYYGLTEVLGLNAQWDDDGKNLTINIPNVEKSMEGRARDIMATFVGSLELIEKRYPEAIRMERD